MFCKLLPCKNPKTWELLKFLKLKLKLQCTPTALLASLTHPCSGAFGDLVWTYLRGLVIFSIFFRRSRTTLYGVRMSLLVCWWWEGGVVFCPIICSHQRPQAPINLNCFWLTPQSRSQWKSMSMAFARFGWTRKLMMLSAVGGCVCPISFNNIMLFDPFLCIHV